MTARRTHAHPVGPADPVDPAEVVARVASMEEGHFWFAGRDAVTAAMLERHVPPGARRVLELGAGTGRHAAALATRPGRRFDVVALDVHLPHAPPDGPCWVAADAEEVPLRDGSVDVVVALDVLEHLDDGRALAECRRVLAPGGVLLAAVPAWPSLWSERDRRAGHRRRYRRRELLEALRVAGFRVLELRGYQFVLLPLLAGSRLLARASADGAAQLGREERVGARWNAWLGRVNRAEAALARRRHLCPPTGSSLVVVATR